MSVVPPSNMTNPFQTAHLRQGGKPRRAGEKTSRNSSGEEFPKSGAIFAVLPPRV
jgi:hypothetical protein